MLTNNQANSSSRDDLRLNQALSLLEQKREKAAEQRLKYEELVNQWRSQENDYTNTIRILRNEFGVELRVENPGKDNPSDKKAEAPIRWGKPADTSWLSVLRNAIRGIDNFASQNDITDHLGMSDDDKERNYKSISSALSTYRKDEHLIGVTVYTRTTHGKAISQILTGLPEFFENPETNQFKPEYQQKLEQKVKSLKLYLSEEEATSQA